MISAIRSTDQFLGAAVEKPDLRRIAEGPFALVGADIEYRSPLLDRDIAAVVLDRQDRGFEFPDFEMPPAFTSGVNEAPDPWPWRFRLFFLPRSRHRPLICFEPEPVKLADDGVASDAAQLAGDPFASRPFGKAPLQKRGALYGPGQTIAGAMRRRWGIQAHGKGAASTMLIVEFFGQKN